MIKTVIKSRCVGNTIILLTLLFNISYATVSVKVFSRNETFNSSNVSTPRIYIQNTGTETINDFTYRYYFTTENGKTPSLEDYYTPNEQIMLVPVGSGFYIQYSVIGANLTPGGLLPHSSGNSVGLHYNDFSAWDKSNDFSDKQNAGFLENQNISVYYNGTKIYGNEPSGTAGSVLREVWTNISGVSTDDIPVNTTPQVTGTQANLDAARNYADNYGVRLRGYITAPLTGDYTFWIASDDNSKLFLSTDTNPANKGAPIASVTGYTAWKQWSTYPSQKSAVKSLIAGTRYYLEVLHKDGTLDDNCSVGWIKPGESGSVPTEIVPSTVLSPFVPAVLPTVPANLIATAVSSQQINLTWTDASNNEFGFILEKKIDTGAFTQFATITANQTSYQVTGLAPETKYYFRICAYNFTGNSAYSNSGMVTTFAASAGSVTRERWTNVTGTLVSNIPVLTPANTVDALTTLETPQQDGDFYGQRIRGYVIPPTTGTYCFFIASDDNSQLWLSTSSDPAPKVQIASVSGYATYHEWTKYSSQKSSPITLTAGVRYYIEVLHKEGNQYDNLSVGWLKPGESGVPSGAIPSQFLSPYIIPSIPNAPDGLTATALSATQVDLTWTDRSNNEDGFRIERALGAGPFVEIGTSASNVTIFHDAGLTANTQYSYRIRAYNYLGNSGYSTIVNAVTLDNATSVPPVVDLLSFAVYSSEKTTLKDHCVFNGGGAVGSNTAVEVFPQAIVNGDVVSGGTILLKPQAAIHGDLRAIGTITQEIASSVTGTVEEGATIATVNIPEMSTITTGSLDVTVNSGENRVLPPGYYKNCTVNIGGTLTLTAGLYTFSSFFLQPEAHVILDVAFSDMVDLEIQSDLEFSDRSTVRFADKGYVPFIRFYTNDSNTVRIGCDVQLNGTLIAPHGDIAMFSRAQCSGALYGKTITIEPDAVIMSDMTNPETDSDSDHVVNIIEAVMGTDPNNSNCFYPIAIPSQAMIDNTQDVTITYDFSVFFPDYPFATAVPVTFPAGSLTRSYIPLLMYVRNKPSEGINFSDSVYERIGRYFGFYPDNGLNSLRSVTVGLPFAKALASLDKKAFQSKISVWDTIASTSPDSSEDFDGVKVVIDNLKPLVIAAETRLNNATLYFDNGCVFSSSSQIQLQYLINITEAPSTVQNMELRVKYTDLTTRLVDIDTVHLDSVAINGGKSFSKSGKMSYVNPVKIDKIDIAKTYLLASEIVYSQLCGSDYTIQTGQTMQILAKTTENNISNNTTNVDTLLCPLNNRELIAVYYPQDVSFETASFGDGRIIVNFADSAAHPYTYEYFMKDHLGSTRMVINDEGKITEAVMYQPYGTMSDVPGAISSAIPVREKFTGKEFDQEGSSGIGVKGMELFYFGARYYDPEIGVWAGTDPISQNVNPYSYCGGNPIIFIDPNGMFSWLSLALQAGVGALQAQSANPDDKMAWLGGAITGCASAAIGELTGELSSAISDAIVVGNSLGKAASIWTELGVSTTLTMAGNAVGQGISIGLGFQDQFNGYSLALSGVSAFTTTGLSIAKNGYLRDSRTAAKQYLSSEQNERFASATGHNPYSERVRFYREGGYLSKSLPGYHISSRWGDRYNKTFNYEKSGNTFAHEMGHHFAHTYDAGGTYNAYGFETYIMGNPNLIPMDENSVRWQLGRPVNVNWERQRMLITPRNDIEFTNWGQ